MSQENGAINIEGIGVLTYQRAMDIARNTEGDLDPQVKQYLDHAFEEIWARINNLPHAYTMNDAEFAVFNYYFIPKFDVGGLAGREVAESAVKRYWDWKSNH